MRIYDPARITEAEYFEVALREPFPASDPNVNGRLDKVEAWIDSYCNGEYIILLHSVMFNRSIDALVFKLKYGV